MPLLKLAKKNIRSSKNHYFLYFLSIVFSVIIFYSFVTFIYDVGSLDKVLTPGYLKSWLIFGSVLLVLFLVIYLSMVNRFLIRRRKKEIGLYRLLGMKKRQIAWLLFIENMMIGLLSIFVGIIIGTFFSKLFGMILLKTMVYPVESRFLFSLSSIILTTVVYLIVIFGISFRTARYIDRYSLFELFKEVDESELVTKTSWRTRLLGFLSLFLLSLSVFLSIYFFELITFVVKDLKLVPPLPSIVLIVIYVMSGFFGTSLFYKHGLSLFFSYLKNKPKYFFKKMNMVTISQLHSFFKKNARILTHLSVLTGFTIMILSSATGIRTFLIDLATDTDPTSYAVLDEYYEPLKKFLKEENEPIEQEVNIHIKMVGAEFTSHVEGNEGDLKGIVGVLSATNYEQARQMISKMPKLGDLSSEEVVMLLFDEDTKVNLGEGVDGLAYLGEMGEVKITRIAPDYLGNKRNVRMGYPTIVLADETFNKLVSPYDYNYHLLNVENSDSKHELAKKSQEIFSKEINDRRYLRWSTKKENKKMLDRVERIENQENYQQAIALDELLSQNIMSIRYPYVHQLQTFSGMALYVFLFVGIVFMIVSGSVIMLMFLSEASDNKKTLNLLVNLGTSTKEIKKNMSKQVMTVFLIPLCLGVMQSVLTLKIVFLFIEDTDFKMSFLSIVFLLVIYGIYYVNTLTTYRKQLYMIKVK